MRHRRGAGRRRGALGPARRQRQLNPATPSVLRTPTARVLDEADEAAVHRLLATDPVAACVLAGRVEAAGTARGVARGAAVGLRLGRRARGGLPRRRQPDPLRRPRCRARRRGGLRRAGPPGRTALLDDRRPGRRPSRRCGTCWRPHWGPARDHRPRQPLHGHRRPARRRRRAAGAPGPPGPSWRPCCPAAVAMFTEEVGVSPLRVDGGAGYRARVAELVRAGQSLAWIEDGEVLFKAEIGAVSRAACQVQGVWVAPALPRPRASGRRARRPSSSTPAPRSRRWSASTSTTSTPPARAAYRRVGFREVGQYASVLF